MKKRGESDLVTSNVIFLILNISFFIIVFVFVSTSSKSIYFYEEIYTKQVALMIDSAKPGTKITLNIGSFFETFEKEIEKGKVKEKDFFEIDSQKKIITFSFVSGSRYSHKFQNNVDIDYEITGSFLILNVRERQDER